MRREWSPEQLIDSWTLDDDDRKLLRNKSGASRLGFSVILKFFELDARFPRHGGEVPSAAVDYVAQQVGVDSAVFASYAFSGRTIEHHRAEVRRVLGFRECTVSDEDKLAEWMADEVCPVESGEDRLRAALLARCRAGGLEPPGPSRVRRVIGTAQAGLEQRFTTAITSRLAPYVAARLEELVVRDGPEPPDDERPDSETGNDGEAVVGGGPALLAELKSDPSRLGLETVLVEVGKLGRVRALGLPVDLFDGWPEQLVAAWRARAARMYPSDLRSCAGPVRLTLLAALCWTRTTELIDGLVDLLIQLVLKINTRAESRVEKEMSGEYRAVRGKTGILYALDPRVGARGRPRAPGSSRPAGRAGPAPCRRSCAGCARRDRCRARAGDGGRRHRGRCASCRPGKVGRVDAREGRGRRCVDGSRSWRSRRSRRGPGRRRNRRPAAQRRRSR